MAFAVTNLPDNDNTDHAQHSEVPVNWHPHLKPKIHPLIENFLSDEKVVFDLVEAFGSPLNIMFPQNIDENIEAFHNTYKKHQLSGRIFYTSKPNKSISVIRQATLHDINLDVSSEDELKRGMGAGFTPERIELTGPKNLEYLALGLQVGATINVDNFTELNQIIQLHSALNLKRKVPVFIRISGFTSTRVSFTKQDNTFGINLSETAAIFEFLQTYKDVLDFVGFSYHWGGASATQRLIALESIIELTFEAMRKGFKPRGINIGGGFHVQYANDLQEWNNYVDMMKQAVLGKHVNMTWNESGLGFRNDGGKITGAPQFMDHYVLKTGADDLYDMLDQPLPSFDNMSAAEILRDSLLDLYIEPGRAMLDQLGITIGRVNFNKQSTHGETLVALDMNRSNIHSSHQKLLTEPVILSREKDKRSKNENGVFYMGNLCLFYDIVQYNKTFPDFTPDTGDLACFINTGPYIMDFIESTTLHQPIAEKVAVIKENGRYRWIRDENYKPAASILQAKKVSVK